MTWALKRQIIFLLIFIFLIAILGFLFMYPRLSKPPTCDDGKQNGTETGVDCGGSCARACLLEQDDITLNWARSFEVVPGRYNAVAYVTNHNKNSAIRRINYRFRFGDVNNVYIGKREGSTFIPAGGNFAIFEPAIDVGNSVPVYTTFEFTELPMWYQVPDETLNQLKVPVSNIELKDLETSPKLSATVKNNSLFTLKNVGVVAVLYGANGNALAASRTVVNDLPPLTERAITFTWPKPITDPIVETEIIPIFDVFEARLE